MYYKFRLLCMVAKTMAEQKFCHDCTQNRDCRKAYNQLGSTEGPSVAVKVIVAFLLPVVVFIGSLAAFGQVLAKAVNSKELQTVLSFLIAILVTFVCILIIKAIKRRAG
jgi:hypothetical protein